MDREEGKGGEGRSRDTDWNSDEGREGREDKEVKLKEGREGKGETKEGAEDKRRL